MIHLTLFTGIQYIKFTAVGEQAVHITITKKICRNFIVMQRTLSNCLCFTSGLAKIVCVSQMPSKLFRFMIVTKYVTVLSGKYPANLYRIVPDVYILPDIGIRIWHIPTTIPQQQHSVPRSLTTFSTASTAIPVIEEIRA